MCCRSRTISSLNSCTSLVPDPSEDVVAQDRPDGYWLEAFYFDKDAKYPDLVGYGLGTKEQRASITLYLNPKNAEYVFAQFAGYSVVDAFAPPVLLASKNGFPSLFNRWISPLLWLSETLPGMALTTVCLWFCVSDSG